MADIFISYRREDTQQIAASVYNFISEAFGSNHVFIDTANIGAGEKFMEVIQQNLSDARVMIVLIGKNWLGDKGDGSNRIDESEDPVHLEVRKGLELARAGNLAVIPVLIDNALMPTPSQLPADILDIQQINAEHIHSSLQYFEEDINRLLDLINQKGVVRRVNGRVKKAPQRLRLLPIIGFVSGTFINSILTVTLVSIIVISGIVVVKTNNFNQFFIRSNPVVTRIPNTYHEYSLPSPNTNVALLPGFLTKGKDGNIWFAESPDIEKSSPIFAVGHITPAGVARVLPPFSSSAFPFQVNTFGAGPIISGSDGNLWVAEDATSNAGDNAVVIARVTPTGVVKEIPLDTLAHISGMIEGPDGNLWLSTTLKPPTLSSNRQGGLVRITPSGTVTIFPVTLGENEATSDAFNLAVGSDGNIWFDIYHLSLSSSSSPGYNYSIGYITPDGTIRQFPLPRVSSTVALNPVSLTTGPDGNIWVSLLYQSNGAVLPEGGVIMRVTPDGSMQEFHTPVRNLLITAGHDGNLWFTVFPVLFNDHTEQTPASIFLAGNTSLYRITPTGTITQVPLPMPTTNGILYLISGPDGNLWFTECNGKIGVYTP